VGAEGRGEPLAMSWLPELWDGIVVTIKLSALVTAVSLPLSIVIATMSISPWPVARRLAGGFVDIFRSIPSLALLIFLYYGVGTKVISPLLLAGIGLTLVESAYLSEIYRGALKAIRVSQWEAGMTLGLGWFAILRLIVIPEAAVSAIPGTVNMVTLIIKDTSLASLVAVNEITLRATQLSSESFRPLPVYALLALFYIALILPLTMLGALLEQRLARRFRVASHNDHRDLLRIGRTPLAQRLRLRPGSEKS
jgi:His/Glu/Gln/Arg/opine family amino acid ABC transporter permease subunit